MVKILLSVLLSFATTGFVAAQTTSVSPLWGQCGGQNWSGPTACASGSYCYPYNPFYSQCIPASTLSVTSQTRTTTTGSVSTRTLSTTTGSTRTVSTVTGSTRTVSTTATPTSSGVQIRGVSDPVYHLYLQSLNGVPVLGPEASSGYYTINGSIRLNSASPQLYLNIVNSTTSYKTLTFDTSATFTGWNLEGDTLATTSSSAYGRQLAFLACPASQSGYYQVYLQMGSDTPSSSCTVQSLHLPCLC